MQVRLIHLQIRLSCWSGITCVLDLLPRHNPLPKARALYEEGEPIEHPATFIRLEVHSGRSLHEAIQRDI